MKKINSNIGRWILSSIGTISVVLSLGLVFAGNASAAILDDGFGCYVENTCGVACNGTYSCSAKADYVICDGVKTTCKNKGDGGDVPVDVPVY
ncbi:MAG: hypothetical protein ACR2N3_06545 [Pyrinomonadaceae bacterium]